MIPGVLILILSFLAFSFRLNTYPLMNWDEAWYAEIIKNLTSGRYGFLVPYWNGSHFFDKPPLYFWLSFPLVKLFGVGDWQVRLVALVAGALAVLFTYLIANHLFGRRTAIMASAIFISLGQVWVRFSSADLDSLQIFLFLACIYFFLKSKNDRVNVIYSGLFLGLSYLVKSWLVGLFPFVFVLLYSFLVDRSLRRYLTSTFIWSLFVASWWYFIGFVVYGSDFISWYILSPAAGNFRSGVNFLTPYYLKQIISDLGLWLVPLFRLFLFKRSHDKSFRIVSVVLLITILFVVILQFSADKFNWYLLPLYPLFAIILARAFALVDLTKNRLFLFLLIVSFIGQLLIVMNIYVRDPDLSRVGADLGKFVAQKIARGETVILDDKDFPAFIYYSNLGHVIVTTKDGGEVREPWIISYQNLARLPRPYWVVTRDWGKLNLGLPKEIINSPYNYRLVKFDTWQIKL